MWKPKTIFCLIWWAAPPPVYNGPSTDGPSFVCAVLYTILVHFFRGSLWQFIFFHVTLFSCCTFFILHHFHVALFCVRIFHAALLSGCTLFKYCSISCCTFTRCNVSFCILLLLRSSHVASFSSCSLFMLHYFRRCSQEHHKRLWWRALQQ